MGILKQIEAIKLCSPVDITDEQYVAIESLVVAYMAWAHQGEKADLKILTKLDEQFDRIFKRGEK